MTAPTSAWDTNVLPVLYESILAVGGDGLDSSMNVLHAANKTLLKVATVVTFTACEFYYDTNKNTCVVVS